MGKNQKLIFFIPDPNLTSCYCVSLAVPIMLNAMNRPILLSIFTKKNANKTSSNSYCSGAIKFKADFYPCIFCHNLNLYLFDKGNF